MRRWRILCAVTSFVAAGLLAGCGAAQPPISGAGSMARALAPPARTTSGNYQVIYNFGSVPGDGHFPYAGLIAVGGTLYGTTINGGSKSTCGAYPSECGTVFSIEPGAPDKVLHTFGAEGDGNNPQAGLIDVNGTLYGTTTNGGSYTRAPRCTGSDYFPCGTLFSITPSGTEAVLHSFGDGRDGLNPTASLIDVNGTLYGTTANGGKGHKCNGGCGTVFSITPSGTYKVLHNFGAAPDGATPAASLIEVKGKLYGTTYGGGAYRLGTVFSITLGGREKVLHSFGSGTDGFDPSAALVDLHGTLYGTTDAGGSSNCNHLDSCGTVFSMTLSGNETVVHRFVGADGAAPVAPLIAVKGTLYGTTQYGGAYSCDTGGSCGTVFSITPSGKESVLHSFGSAGDGIHPVAALTNMDGTLYGTTTGGGTSKDGTVFALTP